MPHSATCRSSIPFVVNDPGEGVQAKRRVHAVIVDHLVPPMMRADTYDEMAELEALLDEYARLEVLDPTKLPSLAVRIWSAIERANLQTDLGVEERPDDVATLVEHIDGYLCEVKDIQIKDGLHILGQPPRGDQMRGLVSAILRLGSGDVPGLRSAVGAAFGLDEPALVAAAGSPAPGAVPELLARFRGPSASSGDLVDRLEAAQMALLDALAAQDWRAGSVSQVCLDVLGRPDDGVERALRFAAGEVVPRILQTTDELGNVLAALNGRHVPSGPSGSPTRGRVDVLPTGRNFYSVDPRALPSELSWEVGCRLADALLDRFRSETGELPRMVGLVAWGTSAMRTQGDDVAEILALLGVRPTWHPESRRVTGLSVIPLAELGRPRIDVTVRISGFFRDAFPHLVVLLDDAVAKVAALDESPDDNYVAAHARADAERLASELGERAWRRATTRVFGSKPGTYGAGLLQLVDARDWRDDADIAQVYEAWGGFAYGRGLEGAGAGDSMRDCFGRIEVAVKNVDSREHDILDSDDYYQYHGGMVATVRALTGRDPAAYLGDSSDPSRVVSRTLAEETRRVFRARVANPRWIASMIRHGYKGAAELSATVDYLFGYDATTGVAEDWMYEQVAQRYLLDADIAEFMTRSNPWAARAIAERLLEAADRGLWAAPDDSTLAEIRDRYLALEGELEEAGSVSMPYPLTAIVGQEELIEALLANAVSPEIGGVLVRGERGTAKTTAVRGLAALLPPVTAATGQAFAFGPGRAHARGSGACGCTDGDTPGHARRAAAGLEPRSARGRARPRARAQGREGIRGRAPGPRPPGHPLRRRGQPPARSPRGRAARRRCHGRLARRARRRLRRARSALPARRHDERRGGGAATAAARSLRARRRGARASRARAAGRDRAAAPRLRARSRAVHRRMARRGGGACSPHRHCHGAAAARATARARAGAHRRRVCGARCRRRARRHRDRAHRARPGRARRGGRGARRACPPCRGHGTVAPAPARSARRPDAVARRHRARAGRPAVRATGRPRARRPAVAHPRLRPPRGEPTRSHASASMRPRLHGCPPRRCTSPALAGARAGGARAARG